MNPRPFAPEANALPDCATLRRWESPIGQGAFVSFALDGADSVICNHWTNMLQEVRFSCNPINLPSNELVRITNNGCGELYEQLPDDSLILITEAEYQANEISERRFKLHGHSASSVFMEEKISIEHISSGAVDEASYTVLEINLVPDYDRNGIIDAIDHCYPIGGIDSFLLMSPIVS